MNNPNEQLQKIEDKLAQLKAQKQALLSREREKERKARTRRLIQNGALAEQYLEAKDIEPTDFEKLLKYIVTHPSWPEIRQSFSLSAPQENELNNLFSR